MWTLFPTLSPYTFKILALHFSQAEKTFKVREPRPAQKVKFCSGYCCFHTSPRDSHQKPIDNSWQGGMHSLIWKLSLALSSPSVQGKLYVSKALFKQSIKAFCGLTALFQIIWCLQEQYMELFNHTKNLYSQSISFQWYVVLRDLTSPWQVPRRHFGLG